MKKLLSLLLAVGLSLSLAAQKIESLKLWDVEKEDVVALSFKYEVAVFIFTSTDCPFDQLYEDRIEQLIKSYQGKADFFLINAHSPRLDNETSGKIKTQARLLGAPYYVDIDKVAKQMLKVEKSPELAILKKNKGVYEIAYRGAIDDSPQSEEDITKQYAIAVLDNLLANKPAPYSFERAAGCRLR